jgi:hypothetical protein
MPNPLRIPAWLAALSAVAIVGALIRVLEVRGAAGITGFFAVLLPVTLVGYGTIVAERIQTRGPGPVALWPSVKFRRRLFLALLIVTDCYCVSMLLLGPKFLDAFGI